MLKEANRKYEFVPNIPVYQLKEEKGDGIPNQRQTVAVISQDKHTDYTTPIEPSIEAWQHFYETHADVLRGHLEEEGAIEFEPEFSNGWRDYTFDELVALQARVAGGLLLTAPAGTGKTFLAKKIAEHLR